MLIDKEKVKKALKSMRENSPKRNFDQSVDMIILLKDLDFKKNNQKIDVFIQLPHQPRPNVKICAFVDEGDYDSAKKVADFVVTVSEFDKYKDKRIAKKLAKKYDFFIASVPVMPKVAAVFGRVLGSRGKMPNPKIGAVFPPKTPLAPIVDKLKKTVRLKSRDSLTLQTIIGKESFSDDMLLENITALYEHLIPILPNEDKNIKKMYLKTTMGKIVQV